MLPLLPRFLLYTGAPGRYQGLKIFKELVYCEIACRAILGCESGLYRGGEISDLTANTASATTDSVCGDLCLSFISACTAQPFHVPGLAFPGKCHYVLLVLGAHNFLQILWR